MGCSGVIFYCVLFDAVVGLDGNGFLVSFELFISSDTRINLLTFTLISW